METVGYGISCAEDERHLEVQGGCKEFKLV